MPFAFLWIEALVVFVYKYICIWGGTDVEKLIQATHVQAVSRRFLEKSRICFLALLQLRILHPIHLDLEFIQRDP